MGKNGGRQDITLASGCWTRGIVAHEIGWCNNVFDIKHNESKMLFIILIKINTRCAIYQRTLWYVRYDWSLITV